MTNDDHPVGTGRRRDRSRAVHRRTSPAARHLRWKADGLDAAGLQAPGRRLLADPRRPHRPARGAVNGPGGEGPSGWMAPKSGPITAEHLPTGPSLSRQISDGQDEAVFVAENGPELTGSSPSEPRRPRTTKSSSLTPADRRQNAGRSPRFGGTAAAAFGRGNCTPAARRADVT